MIVVFLLWHAITSGQSVRIGTIDIYGNRKYSNDQILSTIPLKEGDSVDQQMFLDKKIQASLEALPGIVRVTVTPVC